MINTEELWSEISELCCTLLPLHDFLLLQLTSLSSVSLICCLQVYVVYIFFFCNLFMVKKLD